MIRADILCPFIAIAASEYTYAFTAKLLNTELLVDFMNILNLKYIFIYLFINNLNINYPQSVFGNYLFIKNYNIYNNPKEFMIIAISGPIINLILAFIGLLIHNELFIISNINLIAIKLIDLPYSCIISILSSNHKELNNDYSHVYLIIDYIIMYIINYIILISIKRWWLEVVDKYVIKSIKKHFHED